jgi:eukaryotic-like serine/threonine-protein kinase
MDAQDSSGRVGLVGKVLGRYQISAELGRGGMATVYRAYDPQLSRDVAVKVMHGAFTGRGDIERRFRREAQVLAGLKHPGIVAIFDFAPGGDGEPAYIVSELVEGPTLRQLLDRCGGRLVPEIATLIGSRIAAALGAAHAGGIVHRDVKPDNMMLHLPAPSAKASAGQALAPRVLLTDFGIARMLEDETMTATGSILGSPSYMSPEQAKGGAVIAASDVFSLGVTLYQLATGRLPFPGRDPLTVIAAIARGEFLRPSQVEARVGPELEAVIMRCLRPLPAERFPDGTAAHTALREVAEAGAVSDGETALQRFVDDRAAFERDIGRAVADAAVADGQRCVGRGELSRALGHINRALAYAPGHRGAESLLATISSRRRWIKRVMIAAAIGGAGVAGLAVSRGVRAWRRPAPVAVAAAGWRAAAPVADPPAARAVSPATAAGAHETRAPAASGASPSPPPSPSPSGASSRRHVAAARKRAPGAAVPPVFAGAAAPAPGASPPTAGAALPEPAAALAPAQASAAAQGVVASAPAPTREPPSRPAAELTLRASHGFCSPSLDDGAPALRAVYHAVPAGTHRIFCTLSDGKRALVAVYDLRPGTHPNLVVVPGPDGKPALGQPD